MSTQSEWAFLWRALRAFGFCIKVYTFLSFKFIVLMPHCSYVRIHTQWRKYMHVLTINYCFEKCNWIICDKLISGTNEYARNNNKIHTFNGCCSEQQTKNRKQQTTNDTQQQQQPIANILFCPPTTSGRHMLFDRCATPMVQIQCNCAACTCRICFVCCCCYLVTILYSALCVF